MNIILYGTYPHLLEKTKDLLLRQWYNVLYAQDGYTNLNRWHIDLVLKSRDKDINILLVARSTPDYPIQEIRTLANKDRIREYWLIVMNQAGTFDFWVGEQKRAPKIIRKLKLEWLWRLIFDPKRNMKKVLSTLTIFKYIFSYLLLKKD
jgi:exopolysaccharide biosynthesis WecB/TagA/CpsF family protein